MIHTHELPSRFPANKHFCRSGLPIPYYLALKNHQGRSRGLVESQFTDSGQSKKKNRPSKGDSIAVKPSKFQRFQEYPHTTNKIKNDPARLADF
jgi:hypothetical protein